MASTSVSLGNLVATMTINTVGLDQAEKKLTGFARAAQNRFTGMGTMTTANINSMSQRARTFGYLATAALTAPLVGAAKASIKMASDFEFSMQKIVGLVGVAQTSVNAWSGELLRMGKEIGVMPKELADALYFITSAGIKGAESLDILRISAKAAAAGLGETKTVAHLLTSVMAAYKTDGITAAESLDILVAAVREGKAEASSFATSLGSILPVSSSLGTSFADVAASMASMTVTGSSTAQAATYLRGIFNALYKESKQGATVLGKMNTSYTDLRTILREGGTIALLERVKDLSATYGETLASKVFPNIRALIGYLDLAGQNLEYNKGVIERVTNATGSFDAAVAATSDTIKIRLNKMVAGLQGKIIGFGQSLSVVLIPKLEKWIDRLSNIIEKFEGATAAQKKFRVGLAIFLAAMGPVSLIISLVGYTLGVMNTMALSAVKAFNTLRFAVFMQNAMLEAMIVLNALATTGIRAMVIEMKAMSVASKFTWVGIAALAIGGLIFLISKLTKKHKELEGAQKLVYDSQVKVTQQYGREKAELEVLVRTLKDENLEKETKKKLLAEFNAKYGSYLDHLLTEENLATDLATAYQLINIELKKKIELEAKMALAGKLGEKVAELEMKKKELAIQKKQLELEKENQPTEGRTFKDWKASNRIATDLHKLGIQATKTADELKAYQTQFNLVVDDAVEAAKKIKEGYVPPATGGKEELTDDDLISAASDKLKALQIMQEQAILDSFNSAKYKNNELFKIEVEHDRAMIALKKAYGKDTTLLEAELDAKVSSFARDQKKIAEDELKTSYQKQINDRATFAKIAAKNEIKGAEDLARKIKDIEIDKQQELLWLSQAFDKDGVDISAQEAKIAQERYENSKEYQELLYAEARARIETANTHAGVLDQINEDVHRGLITEGEAIIRRRQAYVDFYDFLNKSAEENYNFIQSLSKRELSNFIRMLDEEIAAAEEGSEKKIMIALREQAIIEGRADRMKDKMKSIGEVISQQMTQLAVDLSVSLGETIGNMMSGMEFSMNNILGLVADFLVNMGKALVAAALATEAFMNLIGNPAAAAILGIAAIAAGTYLKNIIKQGPFGDQSSAIPMADGGLAYGSAFVNVGEYPGAAHDPEVIQRASRLMPMIQDAVGSNGGGKVGRLYTELDGKTLRIVLEEEYDIQKRN